MMEYRGNKNKSSLWEVFTAAPHRIMFLAGAVQLVLTLFFWSIELTGRYSELWLPLSLSIDSTFAHIYLMIYSIFPFFTFGFLMTTYPKWMNGETVPKNRYLSSFLLQVAGVGLFYLGLLVSKTLILVAITIHLVGWLMAYRALLGVYIAAKGMQRQHATHLNIAIAFGIMGELLYLLFLTSGNDMLFQLSIRAGFWLYIIPLLITVTHKMLPLFSSNIIGAYRIIQPPWSLPFLWAGLIGHISLELAGKHSLLFLFDIPLLLFGLYHTVVWKLIASFKERLLAVLHISFLWFSIGIALYTVQSLWLFINDASILGKAPLHAIAIGFLTSMVIAMGTRVSLGHSGRPLRMDDFTWRCFWGIQAAAMLRILAEVDLLNSMLPVHLNLIASLVWLASLMPWAFRYGTMYLKPRIDGYPG